MEVVSLYLCMGSHYVTKQGCLFEVIKLLHYVLYLHDGGVILSVTHE